MLQRISAGFMWRFFYHWWDSLSTDDKIAYANSLNEITDNNFIHNYMFGMSWDDGDDRN